MKNYKWILIFVIFVLMISIISACSYPETNTFPPPEGYSSWEQYNEGHNNSTITPTSTLDSSPEKQAERYSFIQDLIAQGFLLKVEKPSTFPYAWVTPLFYSLNFDDKQLFISVVWVYYKVQDSKATIVILVDSKTGKEIGTYSENKGLELD